MGYGVKCKVERQGYSASHRRAHDSQWGDKDTRQMPRAGQAIGKTLLPSPANIRIVTEWYRSGNGKDKEGMKKKLPNLSWQFLVRLLAIYFNFLNVSRMLQALLRIACRSSIFTRS